MHYFITQLIQNRKPLSVGYFTVPQIHTVFHASFVKERHTGKGYIRYS